MPETISIRVEGKVQGVFFRQSTREKALELQLTGEVKNLEDGSVHITVTGEKEPLQHLVKWCQQGPSRAKVSGVTIENATLRRFDSFTIVR